jgi:aspartate-semialdehyde dehydrogenase
MPLPGDADDAAMAEETHRLLGLDVAYTSVQAPQFFGAAVVLHARTSRDVDTAALRQALRVADDITLMESDLPAGMPTPATDAVDSDDVFVGRIQSAGRHCKFWLVFDPIRLEAARLADALENWIEMPANSMLT